MPIKMVNKKVLAIDWDAKNLRLVLVRPRTDGIDLIKALSIPVPPEVKMDDAESLGAFIREAVRQSKVGAKIAIMSVSRDQVVLNTLELPPTTVEEAPALVQFQIAKELPFAADQATIDFAIAGEFDSKEPSKALVAAVRNEDLAFLRGVAREAGLSVERIGLRPYANLIAALYRSPDVAKQTILLVEVGPQLTEINIIAGGMLAFSRAASVTIREYGSAPAEQIEDSRIQGLRLGDLEPDDTGRETVGRLMMEIIRSVEAHRATDVTVNVDHVVVCGASGLEQQLTEALAARFAVKGDLYTPDRSLDLTPQRARELRGFSAPLGLAQGHALRGFESFDFLHPKKPISKRSIRLKKVPVAVAAVLLFFGSAFVLYWNYVRPKVQRVAALEAQVEPMRERVESIKEFREKLEALQDWQKSEQDWPEVLLAMTEIFPGDEVAVATRAEFLTKSSSKDTVRDSNLTLKLRTAELGQVNELSQRLREYGCPLVRTGKETPLGMRTGGGNYHFDTSIDAELPLRKEPPAPQPDEDAGAGEIESPDAEDADVAEEVTP
jgi:Tfp pilus assembly PilM family ATPase